MRIKFLWSRFSLCLLAYSLYTTMTLYNLALYLRFGLSEVNSDYYIVYLARQNFVNFPVRLLDTISGFSTALSPQMLLSQETDLSGFAYVLWEIGLLDLITGPVVIVCLVWVISGGLAALLGTRGRRKTSGEG